MFKALLLEQTDGAVTASIQELEESRLPAGDVTVAIDYSTLNYKDGMILEGQGHLVRDYPHVPGIDFAGRVAESRHPDFKEGDEVMLTGWTQDEDTLDTWFSSALWTWSTLVDPALCEDPELDLAEIEKLFGRR